MKKVAKFDLQVNVPFSIITVMSFPFFLSVIILYRFIFDYYEYLSFLKSYDFIINPWIGVPATILFTTILFRQAYAIARSKGVVLSVHNDGEIVIYGNRTIFIDDVINREVNIGGIFDNIIVLRLKNGNLIRIPVIFPKTKNWKRALKISFELR